MRHMMGVLHVSVQAAQLAASNQTGRGRRRSGYARRPERGEHTSTPAIGRTERGGLWHQCQQWVHIDGSINGRMQWRSAGWKDRFRTRSTWCGNTRACVGSRRRRPDVVERGGNHAARGNRKNKCAATEILLLQGCPSYQREMPLVKSRRRTRCCRRRRRPTPRCPVMEERKRRLRGAP